MLVIRAKLFALLLPLYVVSASCQTTQAAPPQSQVNAMRPGPLPVTLMPDYIFYKHVFRHVAAFQHQADAMDKARTPAPALRNYFINNLGMTASESTLLNLEAYRYEKEMAALQVKVRTAARELRIQYGHDYGPEHPPPRPAPRMDALFKEQRQLTERAHDELVQQIGEERFHTLDLRMRDVLGRNFHAMPLNGGSK